MFSKKTMVLAGAVILIALNASVFSYFYIRKSSTGDFAARTVLFIISPLQAAVTAVENFADGLWRHYFYLISVAKTNDDLRKQLAEAVQENNACKETALANNRLRALVGLDKKIPVKLVAAEVVAKDPSPWYQTFVINKGRSDGVVAGLPVVMPEGVVGHVITASSGYAKVLLIIDRNSAVDSIIQRTRARGITRGAAEQKCVFDYALRKLDIRIGDTVVSSGLDGMFPKGLRIGHVSRVVRRNAGLFQDIELIPYVDFDRIEEVMVILNPPTLDFNGN